MIGEKRWGSLPAKLCLAEFCKDLPITNGFSPTHLLSSCSFYMWIIIRTTKCVLIFSIVYLQEISQIWAWDSSIFFYQIPQFILLSLAFQLWQSAIFTDIPPITHSYIMYNVWTWLTCCSNLFCNGKKLSQHKKYQDKKIFQNHKNRKSILKKI